MRFLRIALLLVLLGGWAPISAQEAPSVVVTIKEGRLSVNAQEAPLQQILAEISRLSGIPVYLEVALKAQAGLEATTVVFQALTIEEGLRRVLRNKNFILVYSLASLAEVRVYEEGKGEFRRLAVETKQPSRSGKAAPKADRSRGDPAQLARLRDGALGNPDPAERAAALDQLAGKRRTGKPVRAV